jgi:threonine dehydratase
MIDYVEKIQQARVYDVALETPLDVAPKLFHRLHNKILFKREDLQPVFSFKCRGAYNKIASLSDEQRQRGVIAASAGNHAQGVAMAAQRLHIRALIVMPETTPAIKIEAVRSMDAEIVLHGDTYDDAYAHAQQLQAETGMTFIHPYDDPEVIAGQGTVAMEIIEQMGGGLPDAVFIPVGGGGLIGGMSVYLKTLHPEIKVIGVEPDDAPCMHDALAAGHRIILEKVGIFADGVAVRQVGEEPFRLAQQFVDEVILVSTDEICAAIMEIFEDTRSIMEPAGALALAGLRKWVEREQVRDKTLVAVNSGANITFDRLRHVAERAELGEQREALLAVTIPERPGSFRQFCEALGCRGISEFNYRFAENDEAHIFVGIKLTGGHEERQAIIRDLTAQHYPVVDMTDNEMAKMHVRYMVGGRAPSGLQHELLYRFEFPERPGALLQFLDHMGQDWNISLFHYRNHGSAYGRVLVGIQVPPAEVDQFHAFLDKVGYPYWSEEGNPAYALFLG